MSTNAIQERAERDRTRGLEEALTVAANALLICRRVLERADAGQVWINHPTTPARTPLTEASRALRMIKHRAPDLYPKG